MPERGIVCVDPPATRALARIGGVTSCYRCLAYRPETESGCFFVKSSPPHDCDTIDIQPPEPRGEPEWS